MCTSTSHLARQHLQQARTLCHTRTDVPCFTNTIASFPSLHLNFTSSSWQYTTFFSSTRVDISLLSLSTIEDDGDDDNDAHRVAVTSTTSRFVARHVPHPNLFISFWISNRKSLINFVLHKLTQVKLKWSENEKKIKWRNEWESKHER